MMPTPEAPVPKRWNKGSLRPVRQTTNLSGSHPKKNILPGTLAIAEQQGLLKGRRTLVLRGRMPEALVAAAKRKTGITSDSKLLELALANIAVADDYAAWLYSQRGTVAPDLDLEF